MKNYKSNEANGWELFGVRSLVSIFSMSLLVACGPVIDEEIEGVSHPVMII